MHPILFRFGPVTIYSFGVLMALGFYVGTAISAHEYQRRGGSADRMWSLLVWAFVAGLVSSKLLSVAGDMGAFLRHPVSMLVSGSGFVWFGGLIGGTAAAWLLTVRYKMQFSAVADCAAIGIPFGHAIGRIGCHVAGDGDWGTVTNLPWGVAYTHAFIGWDYPPGVRVHPTPIYEAVAYTIIGLVLWKMRKKDLPSGTLLAWYLLSSSIVRFLVEFIRINPKILFGLSQAQWISMGLALAASGWLMTHRGHAAAGAAHVASGQAAK